MAVYLDTNVLVHRSGLDSLELSTLRALCSAADIDIVVPSIVADEVESSRLRNIEAAFDSLRTAHREAGRYGQIAHLVELPTPGELARAYRDRIETEYRVTATPAFAPEEALHREAFRLRPARAGSGARDAAIWITVREDHLQRTEDGFLVTNNSKDFAAVGDNSSLYPTLADEVAGHPHPLSLFPSVASLLPKLAGEAAPLVDEATLVNLGGFYRAVSRLFQEPDFMAGLRAPRELNASDDSRLFVASELTTQVTALHESRGYQVGSHGVTIGRVAFDTAFELGTLEKAGLGQVQKVIPVVCSATALVWFVETAVGTDPTVEISQVVSAKVAAV